MTNQEPNCYKVYFRLKETNNMETIEYHFEFIHDGVPLLLNWILKQDRIIPHNDNSFEGFCPIWLKIHSAQDILVGQSSSIGKPYMYAQDLLKDSEIEDEQKIPIIHLTLSDLYVDSLFGTDPLPLDMPRSYMIMDNSIWNYLVPLSDTFYIHDLFDIHNLTKDREKREYSAISSCKENFYKSIKSICRNYEKRLYRLKVACEYADLNARLVEQSFLSGAHASGVNPFIFHSERATKQLIQREFRLKEHESYYPFDMGNKYVPYSKVDRICNHKWRILLLDDKAVDPMESVKPQEEYDDGQGGWNCKKSIIYNLLTNQLDLEKEVAYRPCSATMLGNDCLSNEELVKQPNKNTIILIEYAQSLKDAQDALEKKKYDLILLDYLLNQKDGTHYGYELLERIYEDQDKHKNNEDALAYKFIRPHHHLRMYCMFISAYSSAVHDRLLAEGLNQSEKYWYINLGACPTNTPQLFLYNLIKIMDKRLDDSNIDDLSIEKIIGILEKIYEAESVRKSAGDYYEKIQSCQYFYRNLLQDYDISVGDDDIFEATKSVLVTDFLNHHINMGGLLEHLAQLIHLTAFGTVRQWPEMWEEYLYVKAQMEAQIDNNSDTEKSFARLCNNMEGYILKLKSSAL